MQPHKPALGQEGEVWDGTSRTSSCRKTTKTYLMTTPLDVCTLIKLKSSKCFSLLRTGLSNALGCVKMLYLSKNCIANGGITNTGSGRSTRVSVVSKTA